MRNLLWRELISAARRTHAWMWRWAGPLTLLLGLGWLLATGRGEPGKAGGFVFHLLGKLSVLVVWVMVPVLTADSIAGERREGTLGLLWLTPLKPREVVVAKLGVHALRAVIVSVSSVPVLLVPILMGGVGWPDVARLAGAHVASMGLALSAGLLASSWWRGWWAVRLGALMLTGLTLGTLIGVWTLSAVVPDWGRAGGGSESLPMLFYQRLKLWMWMQRLEFFGGWTSGMMSATWRSAGRMAGVALVMIGVAAGVGRIAIWRLERSIRRDARGAVIGAGGRWMNRRGGRVMGMGMTAGGGLFLLGAWVDWPTVDHVRDAGWVAGGFIVIAAALLGATRLRGFWTTGHAELMAVIPGGHGTWIRQEMREVWGRLWPALTLVLAGHGVALVAVLTVRAGLVPWWLAWELAGSMGALVISVWASVWMAFALAYRHSPRTGFFAVLLWVAIVGPLLSYAVAAVLEHGLAMIGWGYLDALDEVWRSSRVAWLRVRIGSAVSGWWFQLALTAWAGWGARSWLLNRAGR